MGDDDNQYSVTSDAGRLPTLGRIALKQVRVDRSTRGGTANHLRGGAARSDNPMNQLVPYLDLFARLDDEELTRLTGVEMSTVTELRKQVDEINRALAPYLDLVDRLSAEEFVRLTGASVKTIRFWKLCQPRKNAENPSASSSGSLSRARVGVSSVSQAAESSATMERVAVQRATDGPVRGETDDSQPPRVGDPDDDDEADFAVTLQE